MLGTEIHYTRSDADLIEGINITNYEMIGAFDPGRFDAVVLDESSILKSFDGKTKTQLVEFASVIPMRLACTATPAPNDLAEICNHAEFLGVMRRLEVEALFFTQDGNNAQARRLKGHARNDFWRWLSSWSVALRSPADIGFDGGLYDLPPLTIEQVTLHADATAQGTLFHVETADLNQRRAARKNTIGDRVKVAADMVNASADPWIVWCDLNSESDALTRMIPGAVEVKGSDTAEHKADAMIGFAEGRYRVIVTKPSICGFGMNWQHCNRMAFVGLSDSYEQYYQAIRRCYRFGQKREVTAYVITTDAEGPVVRNIQRKGDQAQAMTDELISHMTFEDDGRTVTRDEMDYKTDTATGDNWTMMLGDSVERINEVPENSVGLMVFSPPFPGMYAYSNSARDMGNTKDFGEMMEQYRYLIPGLLRALKPGRSCAVHLTQSVASKTKDGYMGLKDFRGEVIRAMSEAGFVYYGEVCIDKCPQLKAIRTKDHGLMFKSLATDASRMHMALADYILQFRKPGENEEPIRAGISQKYGNTDGWITDTEWIEWAAPVWYRATADYPGGIRETDVLNVSQARETDDERHLCPLQLGVIERCVKLWSNPGDTVLSPFGGIGSEGYEAMKHGRKYIGIELKPSYWKQAIRNLRNMESLKSQPTLFDGIAV
jgi:DNA modification methylase